MELTMRFHARNRHEAVFDADADVAGVSGADRAPAAGDQEAGRHGADEALAGVRRNVLVGGAAFDPAGASAQVDVADGVVHGAERAALLRAARLQPALSLVSRYGHGRSELGADGVHEEPRSAHRARRGPRVSSGGRGTGTRGKADEPR